MAVEGFHDARVQKFWEECQARLPEFTSQTPDVWAFGATPEQADALLELVLSGKKTATAASLWEYEEADDPLPSAGLMNIILDGRGRPRALIETTEVEIVPFGEVTAAHAYAEGEGDRTLEHWRRSHEQYWRMYSESPRGFEPDMPVVCERFRLLWAGN